MTCQLRRYAKASERVTWLPMSMSWQSDAPNPVNRAFIRTALEDAADNLNRTEGAEVEDVVRLDHDTQGMYRFANDCRDHLGVNCRMRCLRPGCDLYSGQRRAAHPQPKRYDRVWLCAEDSRTGEYRGCYEHSFRGADRQALRYAPLPLILLTYDLARTRIADAKPRSGTTVRVDLKRDRCGPRRASRPAAEQPLFERSPAFGGGATFVEADELFPMWVDGQGEAQRRFPTGPRLFLRLMPHDAVLPIGRAAILEALAGSELWPLGHLQYGGWGMGTNRHGGGYVARHPDDDKLDRRHVSNHSDAGNLGNLDTLTYPCRFAPMDRSRLSGHSRYAPPPNLRGCTHKITSRSQS